MAGGTPDTVEKEARTSLPGLCTTIHDCEECVQRGQPIRLVPPRAWRVTPLRPAMPELPLCYRTQRTPNVCSMNCGGRFVFVLCIHVYILTLFTVPGSPPRQSATLKVRVMTSSPTFARTVVKPVALSGVPFCTDLTPS